MTRRKDQVRSPCIEKCMLNDKKICLGCFRSIQEIAQWTQMDDKMRLEVLLKAANRRNTHDAETSDSNSGNAEQ